MGPAPSTAMRWDGAAEVEVEGEGEMQGEVEGAVIQNSNATWL
jgi:hypothetical protein